MQGSVYGPCAACATHYCILLLSTRQVAVRFCDGTEQLLPIEWVVAPAAAETAPPRAVAARPRLADNWLQQCPVPMVHLLRGNELAEEALRAGADAIDALQCRNAQIARGRLSKY